MPSQSRKSPQRRILLTAAVILVVGLSAGTRRLPADDSSRPGTRPPNIVLIMCDDMGWSDIGCYGGEIETPHIDRLAAGGMRFTQFYNNAVCWTTRASLITGCYPRYPRPHLRESMPTIAERLKKAGYQTALSGKWHLGRTDTTHPLRRGFERFYGLLDGCCNYFDPAFRDPKYKWSITGGGYRYFADGDRRVTEFPAGFYTTDAFTDRAVKMIRAMTDNSHPSPGKPHAPFFLHVCYTAPHYPIHAKPQDIAKYRGKYAGGWEEVQRARFQRQQEMGLVKPQWKLPPLDPEARPWSRSKFPVAWQQQRMEAYAAMIDCVDQGVGRIVRALEEANALDNTIVMFLSDNGPDRTEFSDAGPDQIPGAKEHYTTVGPGWAFAQNTPFRRYKTWMHEGGIATPMIAYWPRRIRPGSMTEVVAHVIDFLPTCLELAGAPLAETGGASQSTPVDGRSFASALQGKPHPIHDSLYWALGRARAVRRGKWKLVKDATAERWELYDLESDRTERNNLVQRYPDKVAELKTAWEAWAEKTGFPAKR